MMATSRAAAIIICGLLYEAATVILTRSSADSTLRAWGVRLRERVGFKRAAVAVARKLAVMMHAMLKTGELFDRSACTAPGSLDKRLAYAARLKDWSCQAARASPGLRWPFFSISHSAL